MIQINIYVCVIYAAHTPRTFHRFNSRALHFTDSVEGEMKTRYIYVYPRYLARVRERRRNTAGERLHLYRRAVTASMTRTGLRANALSSVERSAKKDATRCARPPTHRTSTKRSATRVPIARLPSHTFTRERARAK